MSHKSAIRQVSNTRRATYHWDYLGEGVKALENIPSSIAIGVQVNPTLLTGKGTSLSPIPFIHITILTTLLGGICLIYVYYSHSNKFSFIFQHLNQL